MRPRCSATFALLFTVSFASFASPAAMATSSAEELVREARAYEAAQREDLAARRYTEAISLDPTLEEAYLGLGALRLRLGDAREAERVYSIALEHVPSSRPALLGRARAARAVGHVEEADQDLEAYAVLASDPAAFQELAGWYTEEGRLPAALAIWRRLLALATDTNDAPLAQSARRMVRALRILVGSADPVTSPPPLRGSQRDLDPTRHAIATIARRGG